MDEDTPVNSAVAPYNMLTGPNPQLPQIRKAQPKRIGDILVQDGYITQEQLAEGLTEGRATSKPLGAVLVKLGFVDEVALGKALAKLHGLQYLPLDKVQLNPEIVKLLPIDFIRHHLVVPLRVDTQNKRIEVVMSRPDNLRILDEISLLTHFRPIPRVSTHKEIVALLDRCLGTQTSSDEVLARLEVDFSKESHQFEEGNQALEEEIATNDGPVVQLVNSLLRDAIESDASDVHIEPQKERLLVRFRIHGILKETQSIPKHMTGAVVSRIKVASGMDIAERRRPQDGRMKIKNGAQEIDMRVNSMAVQYGEKICIRLLRPNATSGGLEKLGLPEAGANRLKKMIKAPNGIILVTGPTASGKTTTLYSSLREINSPELNIITIEDPVQYPLTAINQTQVSHKSGLTFAVCLRAILRQDPDVIMVGEIRDEETMEVAIHAALTGHLVFSTLHTNSTAKTITRLLQMGAPPYMISSALIGVLAQRLVRKTCQKCKKSYIASEEERLTMGVTASAEPLTLYKGEGCEACHGSGYTGRVGLYEIMTMNRELAELIEKNASTYVIQDAAIKAGMLTLAMEGKRRILEGMTTIEEVTRVLGPDLEV